MEPPDDLTIARRRFPVGSRVRARIEAVPWGPGRTGVVVDLGGPGHGFVDILHLPDNPEDWPPAGRVGFFEVLQHRPGEVRLVLAGLPPESDRRLRAHG